MERNFKGIFSEEEYARALLKGARKAGSIGCVAEREYETGGTGTADRSGPEGRGGSPAHIFSALSDVFGFGVPFFNPFRGEATALENIEKAFEQGAKAAGLSLDSKDGRGAAFFDERVLASIVKRSPVPVLAKGILTKENALLAAGAGVKGIVLSNRGGRVLECLPSGLETLPTVREALGRDFLLVLDGGIRNGEDVFKALSLGADLVFIGRPVFIFFAGGGEEGVSFYLSKIRNELREAMLVAGAKTVKDIRADMTAETLLT
jgi:4-hydroxymandelate oxidase